MFMPLKTLLRMSRSRLPPSRSRMWRLEPLDKPSLDQTNPAAKPDPDKTDVQLPDEKKSFDQLLQDVHASAALPDDTQ